MKQWYELKEGMEILENIGIMKLKDGLSYDEAIEYRFAIDNILNELKEYRDKISTISEICISESKLHIEPKTAIKEIVEVLGR